MEGGRWRYLGFQLLVPEDQDLSWVRKRHQGLAWSNTAVHCRLWARHASTKQICSNTKPLSKQEVQTLCLKFEDAWTANQKWNMFPRRNACTSQTNTTETWKKMCVCVSLDVWADRLCVCVCAMSCHVQWTFFSCSFLHKMDLKWLTWFNMQKKSCSTHFLTVRQLVEIRRGTHLLEVVNEELGVKPLQGPTWHSTAQHNSDNIWFKSGSNLVQYVQSS